MIKFYKLHHIKRVEDHKGKERGLKSCLKVVHECMQQELQNDILKDRLDVVLEDSRAFEEQRLNKIQKRAMAKLIWKGHATAKDFFATTKERGPLSSKIELETTRWVLVS